MISGRTRVFALLGDPVAHSRSPELWASFIEQAALDATYVCLPTPAATSGDQIVAAVRALGFAAVNLTVPHKETVVAHLDRCTASATRAGAVNLITRASDGLVGHNTDGGGLLLSLSLRWGWRAAGARVLLLGAGGAARAIAAELLVAGAVQVIVLNRSVSRAQELHAHVRSKLGERAAAVQVGPLLPHAFAAAVATSTLIVNATSGGADAAIAELDARAVPSDALWVDVNYWQADAPLLARLRQRRVRVDDGYGMLIGQAVLGFGLATGVRLDARRAFDALQQLRIG